MGGDLHHDSATLSGFANYALFVGFIRTFTVNLEQTLFAHQAFDQRRAQGRADGVGTLDAQHRAIGGYR